MRVHNRLVHVCTRARRRCGLPSTVAGMLALHVLLRPEPSVSKPALPLQADDTSRFESLVRVLPQIVWTADSQGRRNWFNERWYEYTGTRRAAVWSVRSRAVDWQGQLHPDDADRVRRAWKHAVASGQACTLEYRLRARDGDYRWFVDHASPVTGSDGQSTHWCGSCTNIEDYKRTQRLTDSLVALVSHALRTPLSAILGWTHVLQRRPDDEATVRQVADIVERNARLQVQMVDDLLDASRIAAGSMALSVERLDLRDVSGPVAAVMRPRFEVRHLELVEQHSTSAVWVQGDRQRLEQVLERLLSNALAFTPDGGRVSVRVHADGDGAVLTVTDNGRGIAPDVLPHVFDRFQRAEATLAKRAGGLGLGLSIVRGLVELHGGTVAAASDGLQRGATFTVRLPLAADAHAADVNPIEAADSRPAAAAPPVALPADILAGLHVLVVDDEADSRALVARVLRDAGAAVTQADGADEVSIALGRGLRPNLVVSDLGMPRVDGYSLMRMLRELPGAIGEVPTIALSGLNLPQDRARAAQAGFLAFIAKPFSPAELVAVAARLTGRLA